jgi:hypothetical protein
MTDWTGIAAVIAPITTLLGVLGGYWLAGRNEETRDRRAAQRESRARREAHAERLEDDRYAFQRDTLLQLQDDLQALLLITARGILKRQREMLHSGQLSAEPGRDEEGNRVRASVNRLQERVLDDHLRTTVNKFLDLCARSAAGMDLAAEYPFGTVADDSSRHQAVARLQSQAVDLTGEYTRLTKLLGTSLRREMDRRYLASETAQADAHEVSR